MNNITNIVVSSRIRLARNIEKVPFAIDDPQFFENIALGIKQSFPDFYSTKVADIAPELASSLFEQHLISKEILAHENYASLVANKKNTVSIMLGEEDHVRIQVIKQGFNLSEEYREASEIAAALEKKFKIARSKELGYITKCPTNLGSGMRASIMVFLPGLCLTGKILSVKNLFGELKITFRGEKGEGSRSDGFMYQISNQAHIALRPEEIIDMVIKATTIICEAELAAQAELFNKDKLVLRDRVMKSLGILTYAELISPDEAIEHLTNLKLGCSLNIIRFKNNRIIDDLIFTTRPHTLFSRFAKNGALPDPNAVRAKDIKSVIKQNLL